MLLSLLIVPDILYEVLGKYHQKIHISIIDSLLHFLHAVFGRQIGDLCSCFKLLHIFCQSIRCILNADYGAMHLCFLLASASQHPNQSINKYHHHHRQNKKGQDHLRILPYTVHFFIKDNLNSVHPYFLSTRSDTVQKKHLPDLSALCVPGFLPVFLPFVSFRP